MKTAEETKSVSQTSLGQDCERHFYIAVSYT